ncbi:hypothetical protein ANN_28165 [Periplaneta americana]|uniref:Per a allergen n=1 Tax=Periplaneta americana TaxID=6978 RepID=A0ABQ8S6C0_PERAM|nr:hypothetical protein ANN_28165 [Periplaneta americana]
MEKVFIIGTGKSFRSSDIRMAGKTGTAQNFLKVNQKMVSLPDHSIFILFAPVEDPKIAISVIIENGGFGSRWAGPIASLLAEKYIRNKVQRKSLEKRIMTSGLQKHELLGADFGIDSKSPDKGKHIVLRFGYKNTITPAVIQRNILENPNWYTPYTPYQSEISQGRLEALINFQTMISDLTSMKISNASMLDEGTATADAMFMIYKESLRRKRIKNDYFFVSDEIFPQTFSILKTRCFGLGIKLIQDSHGKLKNIKKRYIRITPSISFLFREIYDYTETVKYAKEKDVSVIVSADLLSLTLLTPPGEWNADVVVGSTQSFGIPMGYGGPHAAFFSTREKYKRFLPGRIIGESVDRKNKKAFRMALQTREQHIKRERATSNICTSQVLPAIMASMIKQKGYQFIIKNLEKYLKEITGFSGISLQPNSGAQGEYAGLMVIKAYHHSLQEYKRNVALIPSSSHGTNPASAMMAGMKVILISTKKDGSIDKKDLFKK